MPRLVSKCFHHQPWALALLSILQIRKLRSREVAALPELRQLVYAESGCKARSSDSRLWRLAFVSAASWTLSWRSGQGALFWHSRQEERAEQPCPRVNARVSVLSSRRDKPLALCTHAAWVGTGVWLAILHKAAGSPRAFRPTSSSTRKDC